MACIRLAPKTSNDASLVHEPRAFAACAAPVNARRAVARAVTGGVRAALTGRSLLAVVAIAFGIALGFAVQLVNHAAVSELGASLALLAGDADLEVRGPRAGFDENLYPMLARDADVAVTSPVVEVDAKLRDRSEPLMVLGVDVFRAAAINPSLVAITADRSDTLRGDALFPSEAAAQWLGVETGDTVVVQAGLHELALRVAGHSGTRGASAARYAVMDIAAAQDAFDRDGRLTRIDLRLRPGADRAVVQRRLQALLPPGIDVAPPSSSAEATTRFSRAYRVNLDVLALVALFTGALLVYATQTLAVARRRAQFALLRTLGLSRRQLVGWVIGESALYGVLGAAVGLAAGYAIAWLALSRFGPDLGAGFFRARAMTPSVDPLAIAMFAALGIATGMIASARPAHEASRAAPAAALKALDADVAVPAGTSRAAWALIAAGVAAAFLPAVAELPLFGYLSIALVLIGGILAIPHVAQAAFTRLEAPRALPPALALAHLRATPGRFAATLAAVVASIALMAAMAIMVASFRQSLDDWLHVVLPADLYVRSGSDSAYLSPDDQQAIARMPGVARTEFMRVTSLSVDASRPRVTLLARDIDVADAGARLALVGTQATPRHDGPPPAWISEAVADMQALAPGRTIVLPIGGRNIAFTVAGVFRDYARQQGAVVIQRARYRALTGDDTVNEAALWLAPGASAADVRDAISRHAGGTARVQSDTPASLRALSLATFDRTFAVTYALEAAAVVIGLVGLSASLAAQTLARSREFGVLRHIGMTRRRIAAMLAIEGATLAAIGVVAGLILGFAISLILIHVVNRQSFHWGMDVHVPWRSLATLALLLLSLATLVAFISAMRATGIAAVRAVREDW